MNIESLSDRTISQILNKACAELKPDQFGDKYKVSTFISNRVKRYRIATKCFTCMLGCGACPTTKRDLLKAILTGKGDHELVSITKKILKEYSLPKA